jgi:surface antigen
MRLGFGSVRNWLLGSVLAIALPALGPSAHAATEHTDKRTHVATKTSTHVVRHAEAHNVIRASAHHTVIRRSYVRYSGISCVPYARSVSGITVAGNAWQWWDHAAGLYARGNVPEPGSVLTFRANGRMHLGHVAVVTRVINDREIEVEHSNWAGGGVAHDVPVVDVSENNDWTDVRVGLGRSDSFGSVYPTYGFIYDRPDTGTMLTAITSPAPTPSLNPAPSTLRPLSGHAPVVMAKAHTTAHHYDEVAEAPEHPRPTHHTTATIDRQ